MLVLSRKKDEKIVIGDNIEIMVVEIRGDKVRLGINAPREVSVHRGEVYDAIKREENYENRKNDRTLEGNVSEDTVSGSSGGGTNPKQYSMIPLGIDSNYDTIDMGKFGNCYIPII